MTPQHPAAPEGELTAADVDPTFARELSNALVEAMCKSDVAWDESRAREVRSHMRTALAAVGVAGAPAAPETESNPFDTLADRIRDEAAQSSRSGQMERLEGIAREVERLRQGAKTLGHIIESNGRAILDITGRHDLIGDDGDGDWGAVWDHLYELPAKAWDEGMRCGTSRAMRQMSDEPNLPLASAADNPYRATEAKR